MTERKIRMILLFFMISVLLGGCNYGTEEEIGKVAVEVMPVRKGRIAEEITLVSKLQPIKNMMIIPKTPGLEVTKLAVNVGDTVKEGDFLFELDKTLIRRQVEAARKSYHQAKKNHQILREQTERGIDMPVSIGITGIGLQNPNQPSTREVTESSLLAAEAQLDQARLAYINTLEELDEMEYYAPINGIVTVNNLQTKQLAMNTQPALVISDIEQLKIDLYVTKSIYQTLKIGETVEFIAGGIKGEGTITMINHVADLPTALHNVEITINNEMKELSAGTFCKVRIIKDKNEDTLIIPKKAIFYEGSIPTVYVEKQQKAIKRQLKLGIDGGETVEVVEGLSENEMVIVKGQHYIDEDTILMIVRGEEDEDI